METGTLVRAIHRNGTLKLLSDVALPEGAQVSVIVFDKVIDESHRSTLAYRSSKGLVRIEWLDRLTGVVAVGGDALADREALSD